LVPTQDTDRYGFVNVIVLSMVIVESKVGTVHAGCERAAAKELIIE
jgi:hypothetical protein